MQILRVLKSITLFSNYYHSEVYESYKEAAASYIEAKAIYPSKEGENIKRSVFFAVLYYTEETRSLFQSVSQ